MDSKDFKAYSKISQYVIDAIQSIDDIGESYPESMDDKLEEARAKLMEYLTDLSECLKGKELVKKSENKVGFS